MADIVLQAPRHFRKVTQLERLLLGEPELKAAGSVQIDLSRVEWWNPATVVGTLLIAQRLRDCLSRRLINNVGIEYPSNEHAFGYGSLVGFPEMILDIFKGEPPPQPALAVDGKRIIPATRFSNAEQVDRIANSMAEVFQTDLIGMSFLLQPCHVIFSELADNVLHHAETSNGFVAASQFGYPDREGAIRQIVEIAVGDCGVGIPAALGGNPKLKPKDDSDAIRLALQDGVSSVDDPYRGYGLGYVKREVTKAAGGRILVLRSGLSCVRLYGDGKVKAGSYKPFLGTLAHVIIPCSPASKKRRSKT